VNHSVWRPVEEVALRDLEKKDRMGSGLLGCKASAIAHEFVAQNSWRSYVKYYSTRRKKNFRREENNFSSEGNK
jgi:hypothetical protein